MDVAKVYYNQEDGETIYELNNGKLIVRREEDIIRKLNVNRYDEINFIPEGFQIVNRTITTDEEKELENYLVQKEYRTGIIGRLWNKIKGILS